MRLLPFFVLNQGDQIVVEHLFLAVGQGLEPHEDVVQLVVGQIIAEVLELGPQGGAARMFAHRQRRVGQADVCAGA